MDCAGAPPGFRPVSRTWNSRNLGPEAALLRFMPALSKETNENTGSRLQCRPLPLAEILGSRFGD
jgi:hypothetical protein